MSAVDCAQMTKTLEPETDIWGFTLVPGSLLKFTIGFHVAPLSVLRRKNISQFPGVLSLHTTNLFAPEAAAISSELLAWEILLLTITKREETRRIVSEILAVLLKFREFIACGLPGLLEA